MPRWVDLSGHGVAIRLREGAQGKVLVLQSLSGSPIAADKARELDFEERGGEYVRQGSTISLAELRRVYPDAMVRDFDAKELTAAPVNSHSAAGPSRAAEAALLVADLSPAAFARRATFVRGMDGWRAAIRGMELDLGPAAKVGFGRRQQQPGAKTIQAAHAELIRQATAADPVAGSLPALCAHPKLAYPGSLSRGRMAEINVMRLLAELGVAEGLMSAFDGHVTIHNSPYKDLVIERHPPRTPDRRNREGELFLTHYTREGGDTWIDCEMVFGISQGRLWFTETATYNPLRGNESRFPDRSFANMFSRNLLSQGFGRGRVEWHDRRIVNADVPEPGVTVFYAPGLALSVNALRLPDGWAPVWAMGRDVRSGAASHASIASSPDFKTEDGFATPAEAIAAAGLQAMQRLADLQALGIASDVLPASVEDLVRQVQRRAAGLEGANEDIEHKPRP